MDTSYFYVLPRLFAIEDQPAKRQTLLGVGVLNECVEDFCWKRLNPRTGRAGFYNVGPKNVPGQLAKLRQVVNKACRKKVDVLVLPELCLHAGPMDRFLSELEADPSIWQNMKLLVAGSRHVKVTATARNECVSVLPTLPGARRLRHFKFARFSFKDGDVIRYEGIRRDRVVRVYLAPDWSLTQLICLDFLDAEAYRVLLDMGVTLVTVPAWSRKADYFVSMARSLSLSNQSYTVIANNPVLDKDDGSRDAQGIVTLPYGDKVVQNWSMPKGVHLPALYVVRVLDRRSNWYSCE